jgi:hypothetical protein
MKNALFMIVLLSLCVCPAAAGNRADVNADRAVNAADSVCLANILAGNLDASEFNIENVVVVAPQGGDFTNPADAADWVAEQNPSSHNRFVILVTPGDYELTRGIWLPSYTTLRGYGRENSIISRAGGTASPPYGAVVVLNNTGPSSIEDITLYKTSGGTTYTTAIYIYNSSVRIENCRVSTMSTVEMGVAIYSLGTSYIEIQNSFIYASGNYAPADLHNSVAGIYLESLAAYPAAELYVNDSEIWALNDSGTVNFHKYAYAVVLNVDVTGKRLVAKYVYLRTHSNSAADYYYLYRNVSGSAELYFCYSQGTTNSESNVSRIMCHP